MPAKGVCLGSEFAVFFEGKSFAYSSLKTSYNLPLQVMSLVTASQEKYGDLVTCPIMCLALGVLYEDLGGKLPSRLTDMYMALIKHMIRKNLLRRGEPMCYDVLPDKYNKLLSVCFHVFIDMLFSCYCFYSFIILFFIYLFSFY